MSDSPFAGMSSEHLAINNFLHQSTLATIKAWLAVCNSEHLNCTDIKQEEVSLPTRLIDMITLPSCGDLGGVSGDEASWRKLFQGSRCRLIENVPARTGNYVTLSYCWGTALPYTTTSKNLQQHLAGLYFVQLPKTLQDAIMVARYLGFRYIWIDCICIVQDDEQDWAREAARMADIYSKSALCIAASRASNCDEGFLHLRNIEHWTHVPVDDKEDTFSLYIYEDPAYGDLVSGEWRPEVSSPI